MSSNDEQSPLLGSPDSSAQRVPRQQRSDPTRRAVLTAVLCALVIFVYSLGSATLLTPMAKIFEDIICQRYVRQQSNGRRALEEDRCKAPDVQSELATLQAWSATLEHIPGLLVAVPFGTIADRFGHKLVLVLSSIGVMLHVLAQIIICMSLTGVPTSYQTNMAHYPRRFPGYPTTPSDMVHSHPRLDRWRLSGIDFNDICCGQ